jgi:hypothetical protein
VKFIKRENRMMWPGTWRKQRERKVEWIQSFSWGKIKKYSGDEWQ